MHMLLSQTLGTQQTMAKGFKLSLALLNSLRMCRRKDAIATSLVVKPLPVSTFLLSPIHSKSYEILSFPVFPKPPPCTPTDVCSPRGVVAPSKVHPLGHVDGSGSYSMCTRMTSGLNNELPSDKCSDKRVSCDSNERASRPVQPLTTENIKHKSKGKKSKASASASTSSSGDNDETESLFSSPPSFSSSRGSHKKPVTSHRTATTRRFKRFGSKDWIDGVVMTPDRNRQVEKPVSGRLVPCKEDGKANQSCVVVKRSVDPYEDFKKSILEMIMDRKIVEPKDLEQLLTNFLSLNARTHHQVIIEAFTEILKEVFSGHRTSI